MTLSKAQIATAAISFESDWMKTGIVQCKSSSCGKSEKAQSPLPLVCSSSTPTSMRDVNVVFGEELSDLAPSLLSEISQLPLAIKSAVVCQYEKAFVFKIYHFNNYNIYYQHEHWCDADLNLQHTVVIIGLKDQTKTYRTMYSHPTSAN